jgi:flavin reductase (DIM6/NTAB) family NADH-FMN oxidoreductase RutF
MGRQHQNKKAKTHHQKDKTSLEKEKQQPIKISAEKEGLKNGRPEKLSNEVKKEAAIEVENMFASVPKVGRLIKLEESMFSRLLYPNPVCFLTTSSSSSRGSGTAVNVMTLSWLTPANNYGGFAFVIHKTRFSAQNLLASGVFTLSVPVAFHKEILLSIGKCTGKSTNKFDGSIPGLSTVPFGIFDKSLVSSDDLMAGASSASKKRKRRADEGDDAGAVKGAAVKNAYSALVGDDDDDDEENEEEKEEVGNVEAGKEDGKNEEESTSKKEGGEVVAPAPLLSAVEAEPAAVDSFSSSSSSVTASTKVLVPPSRNIEDAAAKYPPAIQGTVAHMRCRVLSHSDAADAGHHLVVAQVVGACVHPSYWYGGKCLTTEREGSILTEGKPLVPIPTFLGSQKFGYMTLEHNP